MNITDIAQNLTPDLDNSQDYIDLPLNVFDDVQQSPEISDTLIMFAQEIWVCFNTEPYEIISDTKSGGLSLEGVIFNRSINAQSLETKIRYEIDNNTGGSSLYKYDIEIKFLNGSVRDIVVIDIIIFDKSNKRPFKQRFLFQ
jgi:hypothetical protein